MASAKASKPPTHATHIELAVTHAAENQVVRKIAALGPSERVRALAMALVAERNIMNPEEQQRMQMHRDYALGMQMKLTELGQKIAEMQSTIRTAQKVASGLLNRRLASKRIRTVVGENGHVIIMDRLARFLREETDYLDGFLKANGSFLEEAVDEDDARVQGKILLTDPRVRKTIERVDGFLDVVDDLQERIDTFPELCRDVTRAVNRYRQQIADEYGKEEEQDQPEIPSFFFQPPSEHRDPVPVYKENIHLTGFLHDTYEAIPVLVERKKGQAPKVDPAEVRGYMEYLRSLSDSKLLGYVQNGGFFPKAADILQKVCELYAEIQREIDRAGIEHERANHPDSLRMRFRDEISRHRKQKGGEGMRGKAFDPKPILSLLKGMHLHTMPSDIPSFKPDEGSKRERTMLRIFGDIETKLQETAQEDMDDDDWEKFILTLAGLKFDIRGHKVQRRRARIRRDRLDENWAYSVHTRGVRTLELKQMPTTDVTFDDVIGKSWQRVRRAIDDILQWDRLEHLFTTLHPRGNAQKNILTFGSWGMGKNLFSRAILSDPRVIGVTLTTGDIGTAYVNESEANIGRLIDECRTVRDKHGKPVMMVWDEFDDLFPKKKAEDTTQDNIRMGMQKELQVALDGNKDSSGIFLFGMSNAPDNIPIEIYRRMRHIEIIEPLDDVERVQLLHRLLLRMPLEPDFLKKVDISWMNEVTEDTSGEILGTIIDETYERFIDALRRKRPEALAEINDMVDNKVQNGEKLTWEERVALLRDASSETMVTPEMFHSAVRAVLRQPGTREQMEQQQEYYKTIHGRLSQAFEGWQQRPDFLPPRELNE